MPETLRKTMIVVPCFNELQRFAPGEFQSAIAGYPWLNFLFVDDGSKDGTGRMLDELCRSSSNSMTCIHLEKNSGKAEAVRQGFLFAFRSGADQIGYWDADLATPLAVIPKFREILEDPAIKMVLGSRVLLLGRQIERKPLRHYLGRIMATFASLILELPVYDTQCGAKLFRNTPELRKAFGTQFHVGWTFDVEILARFLIEERTSGTPRLIDSAVEYPLECWRDIAGSKIRTVDFLKALLELGKIYILLRFPRKANSTGTP